MTISIKVCGIKDFETLKIAACAGASYLGLVHYPPSPRHIDTGLMKRLVLQAKMGGIEAKLVSVLVNPSHRLIDEVAQSGIDAIQLHGAETPDEVRQIKSRTGLYLIKAHGIACEADLLHLEDFDAADAFLLDAKPPKLSDQKGGLGLRFDWKIVKNAPLSKPWFLAGGINRSSLEDAVCISGAKMIDVSSGLEYKKGEKDHSLIYDFLRFAKRL